MNCELIVRGNVQDVGYRGIVREHARVLGLRGYVFNDTDETVKIMCARQPEEINRFLDDINIREGFVHVDKIDKFEVERAPPLPETFSEIKTDELEDIGRKLEKGNVELVKLNAGQEKGFKTLNAGQEKGFKTLNAGQEKGFKTLNAGQEKGFKTLNAGQEKLAEGQEKGFKSIVSVLERIEKKL